MISAREGKSVFIRAAVPVELTMLQWIAPPTCIYGKPLFGLIELFKRGSMRMGVVEGRSRWNWGQKHG